MAFKSVASKRKNYSDIEALFRDLSSSSVESLYSHQADILRSYQKEAYNKANVAIELPTGSGKTLVGLLIGEYKRVINSDRVLYLCPTKQLVNQVVELANKKYGINATAFTGSSSSFSPSIKSSYLNSDSIAVTTYSGLFNINPFFKESNLIIADDAHSSENYIASAWSVQITRKEFENIYDEIVEKLRSYIPYHTYLRLTNTDPEILDKQWVDKLSFRYFHENINDFYILFEGLFSNTKLKYAWQNIKSNLHACNIFYGWNEILIRPIIPPSMQNSAFANAKQRIFMSATLGNGGDLERITGINRFYKIPTPKGWNKEGLGRRFFVFPQQSLDESQIAPLVDRIVDTTPRTVILLSSDEQLNQWKKHFQANESNPVSIFTAKDIEQTKDDFINNKRGVMLIANRFDGMDFSGDESRALIISEIPYSANYQERFLQSRLNANVIFYDRNRTRLIQAIGRCTRSPKDYSLVLVIGDELLDWLTLSEKNKFFDPELQAELKFGLEQSKNTTLDDLYENITLFFEQSSDWKAAESHILTLRDDLTRSVIPGEEQLNDVVTNEVDYLYALWNRDFEGAYTYCVKVLEGLSGGDELKGYRGFWAYLCGSCAWIIGKENNDPIYTAKAAELLKTASVIAPSIYWLRKVNQETDSMVSNLDNNALFNIEQFSIELEDLKINSIMKFQKNIKLIENYLNNPKQLEIANEKIGKLLGYKTGNDNSSGAPDPWWLSDNNLIYVFEDKIYGDSDGYIPLVDIRQALTHKSWTEAKIIGLSEKAKIITVLVSNRSKIEAVHGHACGETYYWNYEQFKDWGSKVIGCVRRIATKYSGGNEQSWQDYLIEEFQIQGFYPNELIKQFKLLKSIVE